MKLLVYYNVLHKNFNVIFEENVYGKQLGDIYKINSELITIIDLKEKPNFIKICYKKLITTKYKFGKFLVRLGYQMQGQNNHNKIIVKNVSPWWKY